VTSDDKRVFFGAKAQVAAPRAGERHNTDEQADVDVWNSGDERIQSQQMVRASGSQLHIPRSGSAFIDQIRETRRRNVRPRCRPGWPLGRWPRYAGFISDYKRPAADLYRVNTATGDGR
jgi:hypothetical protein